MASVDRTVDDKYIERLYEFLLHAPSWMYEGNCIGMDTSESIMSLCSDCPVKKECYDYAVSHDVTSGIFGGVDMSQQQ